MLIIIWGVNIAQALIIIFITKYAAMLIYNNIIIIIIWGVNITQALIIIITVALYSDKH